MRVDLSVSACRAINSFVLLSAVIACAAVTAARASQSADLTWTPSPSPSVVAYNVHFGTPTAVSGQWELDYSCDLQNWSAWATGYGNGAGDGTDLQVDVSLDPTQPPMFFRAINY